MRPSAQASTATDPGVADDPVRRILVARELRDFGDGLVAVLLPAYLVALGFGAAEVGAVGTIALLGSALMTLGAGVLGTRADPRLLLLLAAVLMAVTGLGFALAASFAAIAAVALVGTALLQSLPQSREQAILGYGAGSSTAEAESRIGL